jgi:hypothetical protein
MHINFASVSSGNDGANFMKVDLLQPWLRQALGLTLIEAQSILCKPDNVVSRMKNHVLSRRAPRTKVSRKNLAGGQLAETISFESNGRKIVIVNTVNPLWLEASKDTVEWFVTECLADAAHVRSHDTNSDGLDGTNPDVGCVLDEDDDDDEDPEMQEFDRLAQEMKQSKDRIVR